MSSVQDKFLLGKKKKRIYSMNLIEENVEALKKASGIPFSSMIDYLIIEFLEKLELEK